MIYKPFNRAVRFLAASTLFCASFAAAQAGGGSTSGAAAATKGSSNGTLGKDTSPLTARNALELVNLSAKEEQAMAKFQVIPLTEVPKKIRAGEEFLRLYPKSLYASTIYAYLTVGYIQSEQMEKAFAAAQKDFELNPEDFRTMAVLSQTLARSYNPSAPGADKTLADAENYGKKSLAGVSALKKSDGMSDADFAALKNETLAMAHSGIGLVSLRKGDIDAAIPELDQAVAADAGKDATNFYLLGVANQDASHPAQAVSAFEKCAAIPGDLQANCKSLAEQSRKELPKQSSPK